MSGKWRRASWLPLPVHPALLKLQAAQGRAQVARMLRGFRSPRRLALSLLAVLLASVWIGQTVASVLLRPAADPAQLRQWIALGMLAYAGWHLLKAAFRNPREPMEWTAAEIELLGGSPLSPGQLLRYRLSTIGSAALLKTACFCLVMLPDIHLLLPAAAGVLLGLLLVDLFRLVCELLAWGFDDRQLRWMRTAAGGVAIAVTGHVVAVAWTAPGEFSGWPQLLPRLLSATVAMQQLAPVCWVAAPFHAAAEMVTAQQYSWLLLARLGVLAPLALGLAWIVSRLHAWSAAVRIRHEQRRYRELLSVSAGAPRGGRRAADREQSPTRIARAAAVGWTHWVGAGHFRRSLLVALLAPAVLSLLPLAAPIAGVSLELQLAGGLAFYSYVLLPTALKFDYRRSVDRLIIFKQLPLSPLTVTLGQLAVPVAITTLFQAGVLGLATCLASISPLAAAGALTVLLPANLLVFAVENLIFMLYPYRLNQEGIEIFLRTVLMFTAKALLLTAGLLLLAAWSLACRRLGDAWDAGSVTRAAVFAGGLWLLLASAGAAAVGLLSRTFRRFDISTDLPTAA